MEYFLHKELIYPRKKNSFNNDKSQGVYNFLKNDENQVQ